MFVVFSTVVPWLLSISVAFGEPAGSHGKLPRLDQVASFDGMRERWAGLMDEFNVPGMAVAIVRDGQIAAIETFGVKSPDFLPAAGTDAALNPDPSPKGRGEKATGERAGSPGAAPTPDTMFYIASITKTYLATAICALADDGKLSLDDPVKKHLPRFDLAGSPEGIDKITIRDLLSHKMGVDRSDPIVMLDAFTGEITDDRYYRWLKTFKATGQTDYSNVHFTLLGRVVEAVSGKSWRDYLEERIFRPGGLTRTTGYASEMYSDSDSAMPMERIDGKWQACRLRKTDRTMHAAGGLGASIHDAARWLILHMNDGEIDGKRVVSAERAREMRTLQSKLPQKQGSIRIIEGFGLGWQVGTFHGTTLCSHGGGYAGTSAYYAMLPEKKAGFAVLMNAGNSAQGLGDVIAIDILDRLIEGDERVDVLDGYKQRAAEHNKSFPKRWAERQAEIAKPLELTKPASAYAGKFESTDLGTLTIEPQGSRLKVVFGECELDIAPAGPDAFKALGPTADGQVFKFVLGPEGEATAVSLDFAEDGPILFKK